MNKILLELRGLMESGSQSKAYTLILGEIGTRRRIPIIIGDIEARSIAMALEQENKSRPLTHDLFVSFAMEYNISFKEIVITHYNKGICYADIAVEKDGVINKIDSRPSDAVAIALRCKCPIYALEQVFEENGFVEDDGETSEEEALESQNEEVTFDEEIKGLSVEELKARLQEAVDEERYDDASKLRDEINKR